MGRVKIDGDAVFDVANISECQLLCEDHIECQFYLYHARDTSCTLIKEASSTEAYAGGHSMGEKHCKPWDDNSKFHFNARAIDYT